MVVPGQVAWDNARSDWANGKKWSAAGNTATMLAEVGVTVATLGEVKASFGRTTPAEVGAPSPVNGETAATRAGRAAHRDWQPPEGFQKEVRLPSGKQADAVNFETREVIELKPNNSRQIRAGEKQVEGYRSELENEYGGTWTGRVVTY